MVCLLTLHWNLSLIVRPSGVHNREIPLYTNRTYYILCPPWLAGIEGSFSAGTGWLGAPQDLPSSADRPHSTVWHSPACRAPPRAQGSRPPTACTHECQIFDLVATEGYWCTYKAGYKHWLVINIIWTSSHWPLYYASRWPCSWFRGFLIDLQSLQDLLQFSH